jgi:putative cell wall-binding protein
VTVPATAAGAAECLPAGGVDGSPPISQIQTEGDPYDRTVSQSRLDPNALDAHDVVFSGGGWGHGVGMSQWAAQGAATLGCSWQQIIQTSFPGTSIAERKSRAPLRLKVWTTDGSGANSVWVKEDTPWRTCEQRDDGSIVGCDQEVVQPGGTTMRVSLTADGWRLQGQDIDRKFADRTHTLLQLLHDGTIARVQRGTGANASTGLPIEYGRFELDYTSQQGGRLFATQIIGNATSSGMPALDTYLLGLMEVPFGWHQQALRAQVVAARSYAEATAHARQSYSDAERIRIYDCRCDLRVDTGDQVWGGATKKLAEPSYWPRWVEAVQATTEQYVMRNDRVLTTFYSSSFGGRSRAGFSSENVNYQSVDVSRWEKVFNDGSGHSRYRWSQGFTVEQLQRAFGIDDIDGIRVVETDGAGYPMPNAIQVTGVDGGQQVTRYLHPYSDVRSRLDLYSPRFAIHTITDLADDTDIPVTRVAGDDRIQTAIDLAQGAWPGGSELVVLARADNPADALTGSALAGSHDAPLLLTEATRLTPQVRDALKQLGTDRVYMLGGEAALSRQVMNDLRAAGITHITRVKGDTRHGTAREVAERVDRGSQSTAYLVRLRDTQVEARGWADALSVSAVAARRASDGAGWPILGTEASLPTETRQAIQDLGITRIVPVGGSAVIPDRVLRQLEDLGVQVAGRLAGQDRYGTSRAVTATDTPTSQSLVIATGQNYPDGLAAGPYAARTGGALLLVPTGFDPAGSPWQAGQHPAAISSFGWTDPSLVAVGGEVAIQTPVIRHVAKLLEDAAR